MEEDYQWRTNSVADIAHTLSKSVAQMQELQTHKTRSFDSTALTSAFQELSLRITRSSSSSNSSSGVDLQERNRLSQKSRQLLQEATHRLKDNQIDLGLLHGLKGCLVALRSSEHLAAQQLVTAVHPVLQTLSILEKSSTTERLTLNSKLLGMRLSKFLQLLSLKIGDLRGPQRRSSLQKYAYLIQKVLPNLIQSIDNSIHRPMNAYDRAARHLFFNTVKDSIESIRKLFSTPSDEDLDDDNLQVGRFVKTVDFLLEEIDTLHDIEGFEKLQVQAEWLITFAMSVAKSDMSNECTDEKDIVNACNHLVNEFGNLKEACAKSDEDLAAADLSLAKEVAKDFIEVTEQSVNSALLRLIVLSLSQLHVPLDRLIHAVLSSDKVLPNRKQEDIHNLVYNCDNHADGLFHIAHFAVFCTSDAGTAQALCNSLHLVQMLEKELVPACLKLYFNPTDVGARSYLKTLRQLWRQELDMMESFILGMVDPCAFCIIVEAEARRIAGKVKKDQYSQDCDLLRLSVSQVVRLCQMAVDFAWKKMSLEESRPNPLPEDHAIIRVERSTWEVQAALQKVISNVEDLHQHKALIRRVQLMVTCTTAMVECLMDRTTVNIGVASNSSQSSRVKVLTSVSRINIGANKSMEIVETEDSRNIQQQPGGGGRLLSKSFKNITMNNTIGVSRKNSMQLKAFALTFDEGCKLLQTNSKSSFRICSRKTDAAGGPREPAVDAAAEDHSENYPDKELYRKIKLHSYSEGFRSPLKQISNQLVAPRKASVS